MAFRERHSAGCPSYFLVAACSSPVSPETAPTVGAGGFMVRITSQGLLGSQEGSRFFPTIFKFLIVDDFLAPPCVADIVLGEDRAASST